MITFDHTRQRGHTLSTCTILIKSWVTCAPPPAFLLSSRLSGWEATGPTLSFLRSFLVPPKSPPFSTWRLQVLCGFLCFFASLLPSPILSSSPFPSPLLLAFPRDLQTNLSRHSSRYNRTSIKVTPPHSDGLGGKPSARNPATPSTPAAESSCQSEQSSPCRLLPWGPKDVGPMLDALDGTTHARMSLSAAKADGYKHWMCMCVCVCVCVFIKLHIATQSGPVILVILCHSH